MAVWMYMPSNGRPDEHHLDDYWCDNCVHRGCSCNLNSNGEMPVDERGREYPCCEYSYDENGYEDEYEDEYEEDE